MTPSGSNLVNECGVILRDDGMTTKSGRFEMSQGSLWTSICQDVSRLTCRLS